MSGDPTPEQIADWYRKTEFGNIDWEELMRQSRMRSGTANKPDQSFAPTMSTDDSGKKNIKGSEIEVPKDFMVTVKIIDRQRKVQGSNERYSWVEKVRADGFKNDTEAGLGALVGLAKYWSPKQYNLELVSVEAALIQKLHIIRPT